MAVTLLAALAAGSNRLLCHRSRFVLPSSKAASFHKLEYTWLTTSMCSGCLLRTSSQSSNSHSSPVPLGATGASSSATSSSALVWGGAETTPPAKCAGVDVRGPTYLLNCHTNALMEGATHVLEKRRLAGVHCRKLHDVMLKNDPPLSTGSCEGSKRKHRGGDKWPRESRVKKHKRDERANHGNAIPFLRVQLAHVALVDLRSKHDKAKAAARQQHGNFQAAAAVEVPQLVADQCSKGNTAASVAIAH